MSVRTLACTLLVACSMSSSPPPSRGLYAPPPSNAPLAEAAPTAAPVAPIAPKVATGVLRVDGPMTDCRSVSANVDGGTTQLCTFVREQTCGLRTLGADGEVRSTSDRAPGSCGQWVARPDGGGFLSTLSDDSKTATILNLDANGRRIARGALTSKEGVWIDRLQIAKDGDVVAVLSYRTDLSFRGARLGTTKFSTSGVVKLRATLDRLAWSRLFVSRRTYIADVMPPSSDRVDVVMNTRGPLVAGTPINPPVNPEDGSIYGGDSYGWKAERVAFDRKGNETSRDSVAEPGISVFDAAMIDDALAVITNEKKGSSRVNLTVTRDGKHDTTPLGMVSGWRFTDTGEGTWVIQCDCVYDDKKHELVGSWFARELAGRKRSIELRSPAGTRQMWTSLVVRDDVVVATGPSIDAVTQLPTMFTALVRLPAGAALDLAALAVRDKLELAPGCRRDRPRASFVTITRDAATALEPELAACGIAPNTRIDMTMFADGGIRTFNIEKASPKVVACARELFEPFAACPTDGTNVSFSVRLAAKKP